jgi:chitin disaccharide deacetylase
MIIVNADDWGRSLLETDAALACYERGRITSASAMVFMEDSERAARVANDCGIDMGLHVNLIQRFSREPADGRLAQRHERVIRFLGCHKYACLLYNPMLRHDFRYVYQAQLDEFVRLYGRPPSHIDGHHHQHLCTNMLLDGIIEPGQKVRRSFHFWPGEKGLANRAYRKAVDRWLARRYRMTDYFFALRQCASPARLLRVIDAAQTGVVEIMAHPGNADEYGFLMGEAFSTSLGVLELGTYSSL